MKSIKCTRKALLRKYHTLAGIAGMTSEDRLAMLSAYGVESSAALSIAELMEVCNILDAQVNSELNKLRKRVIASVGSYLRAIGKHEDISIIKGIACRASGYDEFNKIPKERLRNIYNAFSNKNKDIKAVNELSEGILCKQLIMQNKSLN